ncbi:MAG: selenocysteine-specific translation elongation factor [Deltaproteobacteria bacterium]|nr:selenocysteine-specific translation elongation factor [Deltaproteobacteria bacterium]
MDAKDLPVAVVGTAGHIDHGKSALVRALTGVDPDRLPEEKKRGITIELGYAPLRLPSGRVVSVVDVPGHEKFIKTMAAGAAVVDLCILVVDSSDGVKPQTVEHLAIMQALGVERGIVALTKCDAAQEELRQLAAEETRELLSGTFLEEAQIIETSVVDSTGLDELCSALDSMITDFRTGAMRQPLRIPIDRSFVMPGFGTVVTGTLIGGSLAESDHVLIVPSGLKARARALQVHGGASERILAPSRVALNLVGVDADAGLRGQWVTTPGTFTPSTSILAEISSMPWIHKPIRLPTRMSLSLGASSTPCEVHGRGRVHEQKPLMPGELRIVRIRTAEPVVPRANDRFILRHGGGMGAKKLSRLIPKNRGADGGRTAEPKVPDEGRGFSTLAGGIVIDPRCAARRIGGSLEEQVDALDRTSEEAWITFALRGAGPAGLDPAELVQRVPFTPAQIQQGLEKILRQRQAVKSGRNAVVGIHAHDRALERARDALSGYHAAHPERAGIKRDVLRDLVVGPTAATLFNSVLQKLVKEGAWKIEGDIVSESGHTPGSASQVSDLATSILSHLQRNPATPPGLKDLAQQVDAGGDLVSRAVDLLISSGRARLLHGAFLFPSAFLEDLEARVRDFLSTNEKFLVTDLKAMVGATRKHALPLARWLDDAGVTIRRGDHRILRR